MIYLDTSVALAQLLSEGRLPPATLWNEPLISSRLLEYELWNRIHARGLSDTHGEAVGSLLARVSFVELLPDVLQRALEPFPTPVQTLDGLHLAALDFLLRERQVVRLASFDQRLKAAAAGLGIELYPLP